MRRSLQALFAVLASAVITIPVFAGGLYINEFNTPSMGTAGAGAFALAEDAATAFFNPAGMTRLDEPQVMVGVGFVYSDFQFDPAADTPVPGGDGGDAGGAAPIATVYFVDPINENWSWGINLVSISAGVYDFNDDWAGRYALDELSLFTVSLMPSVGYKINEAWSVGASVVGLYGLLEQELALQTPGPDDGQVKLEEMDDFAFGFGLNAHWQPNEETQFGLTYGSGTEPEFEGDVKINPIGFETGISTELEYPQLIGLSGVRKLNDDWSILGTFRWEDWSVLDEQFISTSRGSAVLPRNWEDTYHGSVGFRYQLDEAWMLQFGIAYDSSPVDDEDRTIDLPMDEQWRYAVGFQHQYSETMKIGGAFTFADYGDAKIDSPTLKGEFENNGLYFFGLNVNWTL